jgi:hypothetical protein
MMTTMLLLLLMMMMMTMKASRYRTLSFEACHNRA